MLTVNTYAGHTNKKTKSLLGLFLYKNNRVAKCLPIERCPQGDDVVVIEQDEGLGWLDYAALKTTFSDIALR